MLRILEPELMTDVAQCQAYATANFGASNQRYVDIVGNLMPGIVSTVLDIGCGPGDVMIRLAKIRPELKITAIDASQKMIQLASAAISSNGLDANIHFLALDQTIVPAVPGKLLYVSADRLTDPRTDMPYYVGRVSITPEGLVKLGHHGIQPGMPADVVIITGSHSLFGYLLKPVLARMQFAFKER